MTTRRSESAASLRAIVLLCTIAARTLAACGSGSNGSGAPDDTFGDQIGRAWFVARPQRGILPA
jgi:hypothetical protein